MRKRQLPMLQPDSIKTFVLKPKEFYMEVWPLGLFIREFLSHGDGFDEIKIKLLFAFISTSFLIKYNAFADAF